MFGKSKKIKELEERVEELIEEQEELYRKYYRAVDDIWKIKTELEDSKKSKIKSTKSGTLCLDFWPPRDWKRLSLDKWNPGRYFQACIGPIRLDWYDS